MTTTARDIMSTDWICVGERSSVTQAAKQLAELGVGAMPICGDDSHLKGMITDRDIVTKVLALGLDPDAVEAGELGQSEDETIVIEADDSIEEAWRRMSESKARRLPVIDGMELVGIVSQADIARNYDVARDGRLVETISY